MRGMGIQIQLNGEPRDLDEATTVADLIGELNLAGRAVAVEVNREIVPKRGHAARILNSGDIVEVVTLVGGG